MSFHDQHVSYVDALTGLADGKGKEISESFLADLKKLMKKANGNLDVFAAMVKAGREVILKRAILKAGRASLEAKKLGKEFGEKKLNTEEEK